MATRRKFLAGSVSAVAGVLATSTSARSATEVESSVSETTSLCGEWFFRADPDNAGVQQKWYDGHARGEGWRIVSVPHTSQVEAPLVDYRGVAWYWLSFELSATGTPQSPRDCAVRVEFEAVFHTATVWVNGPIWMGESGENNDDWIAQFVKTLEKNNIGWAFWPYKKMEKSARHGPGRRTTQGSPGPGDHRPRFRPVSGKHAPTKMYCECWLSEGARVEV